MRHSAFVAGTAMALGLLTLASRLPSIAMAQPPVTTPEVDPKILAFLKPVEIQAGDSELQKKLKERHNVAVRLLDERVSEYKKGVRDVTSVFEAGRLAADAKLDLAESKDARVAVLGQVLEMAKLIETHLEEQLKKGFGSKSDLERARLARLTIEVDLLRSKGR